MIQKKRKRTIDYILYKTFKLETHHNNGNKLDNRMENLTGFLTRTEHNKLNYELTKRGG